MRNISPNVNVSAMFIFKDVLTHPRIHNSQSTLTTTNRRVQVSQRNESVCTNILLPRPIQLLHIYLPNGAIGRWTKHYMSSNLSLLLLGFGSALVPL